MLTALSSLQLTTKSPISKDEYKRLKNILQSLIANNDSIQFRNPVDWQSFNLLDYPLVIKYPMDIGTVLAKLETNQFFYVQDVLDHIQIIWDNCKSYNPHNSWIYNLADKLDRAFKKLVKNYLPHITVTVPGRSISSIPPLSEKKISNTIPLVQSQSLQKEEFPTMQDKQKLADKLKILSPLELGHFVEVVISKYPSLFRDNGETAELILQNIDWQCYNDLESVVNAEPTDTVTKKVKE